MNDLRLLLEDVFHEISQLNEKVTFEAESLDGLLKPWRVIPSESLHEEAATSKEPASNDDSEFLNEMEKVDSLLKKARLIREKQPLKSADKKAKFSRKNQTDKSASKPSANSKAAGGVKSKEVTRDTSARRGKCSNEAARKTAANLVKSTTAEDEHSTTASSIKPNSNPSSGKGDSDQHRYLYLKDMIKDRSRLSKYTKLRNMHSKLRTEVISNTFSAGVCQSERDFISSLYRSDQPHTSNSGQSRSVDDITTVSALNSQAQLATDQCQCLVDLLNYKVPLTDDSPTALYFQKLVYERTGKALADLEAYHERLRSSMVITTSSVFEHNSTAPSFATTRLRRISCSFFTLRKEAEIVENVNRALEVRWLRLNLSLKQRVHRVISTILNDLVEANKSKDPDRTVAAIITTAHGLLAKPNRCAINPAVVLI